MEVSGCDKSDLKRKIICNIVEMKDACVNLSEGEMEETKDMMLNAMKRYFGSNVGLTDDETTDEVSSATQDVSQLGMIDALIQVWIIYDSLMNPQSE